MLTELVAIVMVFGIPLSAILGGVWLKARRMELEAGGSGVGRRVAELEAQNEDLRKRIEVLETIVTSDEGSSRRRVQLDAAEPGSAFAPVEPHAAAARAARSG